MVLKPITAVINWFQGLKKTLVDPSPQEKDSERFSAPPSSTLPLCSFCVEGNHAISSTDGYFSEYPAACPCRRMGGGLSDPSSTHGAMP